MMRMTIALLFGAVALPLQAAPAQTPFAAEAAVVAVAAHGGVHPHHTLPDPTQFRVCRVFKRYGGGVCTSPPYAPIGRACRCEGPHGPRPGVVTWR